MNELVHWILHSRFLSSARVPSVAGSGLPERMRSTAFALLGLTAAAGLALVAIFVQLSFPLLEPAPLPAEPTVNESVGTAEKAAPDGSRATLRPAQPAPSAGSSGPGKASFSPSSDGTVGSPVDEAPAASSPGGAVAPVPSAAPGPYGGNKDGGGGAGGEPGGSNPAPTAAPAPAPAPTPPTATPAPVVAPPAPEPVAPGNSSSAAAAAHASERGIEASTGAAPSTSSTAIVPSDESPGNGYAKGLDK